MPQGAMDGGAAISKRMYCMPQGAMDGGAAFLKMHFHFQYFLPA